MVNSAIDTDISISVCKIIMFTEDQISDSQSKYENDNSGMFNSK